MRIIYVVLLIIGSFYLGVFYQKNSSLLPSVTFKPKSFANLPETVSRGFTIPIEEVIADQTRNPSLVRIERGKYEIPVPGKSNSKEVSGNKFAMPDEDFVSPKIKNDGDYIQSIGFDSAQYIPILEKPGYTQYGYMVSYGKLNRILVYEGSFSGETIFLSDPFTFEENTNKTN